MSTDLGRVILLAVVTAVVSLLVMESYQTTPWLAHRLMQWSVRLRYTDNPARAKVRGEELTALLGDLPTLFKLPTAGAFLLRALAYRLAHRRRPARREPRAVRRSLGVRFRTALVKAGLVVICVGGVIGIEILFGIGIKIAFGDVVGIAFGRLVLFALSVGVWVAIESAVRPPRFPHGLFGGIACFCSVLYVGPGEASLTALFSGVAFGVATRLTCALVGKFKDVGVIIGVLVNIAGVASSMLADLFAELPVVFSGLGLAAGVLAGFVTAVIRRSDPVPTPAVLVDSLSGSDAVNPEPPITIGEPSRHE